MEKSALWHIKALLSLNQDKIGTGTEDQ